MTYVERKSSLKDRSLPHLVDLSELSDRGAFTNYFDKVGGGTGNGNYSKGQT